MQALALNPSESTAGSQAEDETQFTRYILEKHEQILRDGGIGLGFPLDEPLHTPLRNTLRCAILRGMPEPVIKTLQVLVYFGPKTRAERRALGLKGEHETQLIEAQMAGRGPSRMCAVSGAPTPTMRAEPTLRMHAASGATIAPPPPVSEARKLLDFLSAVEGRLEERRMRNDGSADLTHMIFYLKASIDGCGVQEKNGPSRKSVNAVIAEIQARAQTVDMVADKHIGILRWMRAQLETRSKLDRRIVFYP